MPIPKSEFRANVTPEQLAELRKAAVMPVSRERLRQLRKNAAGLCLRASCRRMRVKWGMCAKHAKADSARRKASYAAKKKAGRSCI